MRLPPRAQVPAMYRRILLGLFAAASVAACGAASTVAGGPEAPEEPGPEEPLGFAGQVQSPIPQLFGRPFAIRVAGDGRVFVTHQDLNRVTIIGAGGSGLRTTATVTTDPGDVVLSSDGSTAFVSTFIDGNVHVLNAATGAEIDVVPIGTNAYRLALSTTGQRLFVTTTAGWFHTVDVAAAEKGDSLQLTGSLQGIARRSDGAIAVTSNSGRIVIVDPTTLQVVRDATFEGLMQDAVFSPDGARLYVASEMPARVLVLNGQTLAAIDTIDFAPPLRAVAPFGLALSPDGNVLAVSSPLNGGLGLADARTYVPSSSIALGGTPRRLAFFAGDGLTLYVANESDRIDVLR